MIGSVFFPVRVNYVKSHLKNVEFVKVFVLVSLALVGLKVDLKHWKLSSLITRHSHKKLMSVNCS